MKTHQARDRAESSILAALPGRAHDVARLRALAEAERPVVTVIGKYNHGKSRLLNELIGHEAFSVADKRETVVQQPVDHGSWDLEAQHLAALSFPLSSSALPATSSSCSAPIPIIRPRGCSTRCIWRCPILMPTGRPTARRATSTHDYGKLNCWAAFESKA